MEPLMSYDGYKLLHDPSKSTEVRSLLNDYYKKLGYTIIDDQKVLKTLKYLNFIEIGNTDKTKLISIENNSGSKLGLIKWHGPWRKYCFLPFGETIYDINCLNDITEFINELMNERKIK